MKKYKVKLAVMRSFPTVEVEADDEDEAIDVAIDTMYDCGLFGVDVEDVEEVA